MEEVLISISSDMISRMIYLDLLKEIAVNESMQESIDEVSEALKTLKETYPLHRITHKDFLENILKIKKFLRKMIII